MNIAIVTGASSGMGKEFVLQLPGAVAVDEIWAIARRGGELEKLRGVSAVPVRPIVLDLCREESFATYAALLEAQKPNVRLLVNAAGFGKFGTYSRIDTEDECRMIDLNCKALLMMTRLTVPYMAPGSHILELDSLSAFQPVPYITTYGATKAFVLSYSRAMNRELKDKGIRVMAMNPGWVKTEFFNRAAEKKHVPAYKKMVMADPKKVVKKAWRDNLMDRELSVYGKPMQLFYLGTKIIPHRFILHFMGRKKGA